MLRYIDNVLHWFVQTQKNPKTLDMAENATKVTYLNAQRP